MIQCILCSTVKDSSEFIKDKYTKTGYTSRCAPCIRLTYFENKERIIARRKVLKIIKQNSLTDEQKEAIREKDRIRVNKYVQENREEVNRRKRERRAIKSLLKPKIKKVKLTKDQISKSKRDYYLRTMERRKETEAIYYKINRNNILEKKKLYHQKNKEKVLKVKKAYVKNRKRTDELFKLRLNLRSRIYCALKLRGYSKNRKTEEILGAPVAIVKEYIAAKFIDGMTWETHGNGEGKWHIDHIIPLGKAKSKDELIELCHYTNLQPLWALDNMKKSNKI